MRGVHVDLRRTLVAGGRSSAGCAAAACGKLEERAAESVDGDVGWFRRWVRSVVIGGDKVGGKASLECQRLFRIRDRIAGRFRGWPTAATAQQETRRRG